MEIVKASVPQATRFGVLWSPTAPSYRSVLQAAEAASGKLNRRTFLCGLTLGRLFGQHAVQAQQTEKIRRIGFLSAALPGPEVDGAFRQGLREFGYVEGHNLLIERRFAEGSYDRLAGFAAELVRLKVEVVVALSTEAALAAKKATPSIPIVFTQVSDPVASGVVSNLARPGGNLSGFSILTVELTGKRLELIKEGVPSLKSVIILCHRGSPANALALKEAQIAAPRLGLAARLVEVGDAEELEPTFTMMARERASGVVLVPSSFLMTHASQITELATKRRLPLLAWTDALVLRRALMSYGPNTSDVLRRAGGHVAKILNGASLGDLPVERPAKFELVINLKTAKALGLTIPQTLLLRADEVIE
jgi:putative tryptophan/tyrosine transport system substrate-binding protein